MTEIKNKSPKEVAKEEIEFFRELYEFMKVELKKLAKKGLKAELTYSLETGIKQKPIFTGAGYLEYQDLGGKHLSIEIDIPNYKKRKL